MILHYGVFVYSPTRTRLYEKRKNKLVYKLLLIRANSKMADSQSLRTCWKLRSAVQQNSHKTGPRTGYFHPIYGMVLWSSRKFRQLEKRKLLVLGFTDNKSGQTKESLVELPTKNRPRNTAFPIDAGPTNHDMSPLHTYVYNKTTRVTHKLAWNMSPQQYESSEKRSGHLVPSPSP